MTTTPRTTPRSLRSSLTAALATTLLGSGLLLGAAPGARAAEAGATYRCDTLIGTVDVPVTVDTTALTRRFPTGAIVPSDLVSVDAVTSLPAALLSFLAGLGLDGVGVSLTDFVLRAGSTVLPLNGLTAGMTTLPASGDLSVPVSGQVGGFTAPAPGRYPIRLPQTFDLTPISGLGLAPMTCTLPSSESPVIGTFRVDRQASITRATVRGGTLKVTVRRQFGQAARGKVAVRIGSRLVTSRFLRSGAATVRVPRSWRGRVVTAAYVGESRTAGSWTRVKVR